MEKTVHIFFAIFFLIQSVTTNADEINNLVHAKSAQYGVDPQFVKAIIRAESSGNTQAVSPVGALGIMQLMPATAARFGVQKHELFNPERNIEAGVRYISFLSRLFGGNPYKIAAAYNAGEGAVQKYNGVPPYRETQKYVPRVIANYTGQPITLTSFSPPRKTIKTPIAKVRTSFVMALSADGTFQPVIPDFIQ